jgi:hypothetical protein
MLLALLIAGVAVFYVYSHHYKNKDSQKFSGQTACQVFPKATADKLLNYSAQQEKDTGLAPAAPGLEASKCTYKQAKADPAGQKYTARLTVQRPIDQKNIEQLKQAFKKARPEKAVDMAVYSDDGYWDGQTGSLYILKNNVWYTISYNLDGPEAEIFLSKTETMADLLIDSLK